MRMRALVLLLLAACTHPVVQSLEVPSCVPNTEPLRLIASGLRFDKKCLAARANQPLTITLENQDAGVNHNIAILPRPFGYNMPPKALFFGDIFMGPKTVTYSVPALPAGQLFLICYVHHDVMNVNLDVPPDARAVSDGIQVTWATREDFPAGFVYDVQVRAAGARAWTTWFTATSNVAAMYAPPSPGTFAFRVSQYRAAYSPLGWSAEATAST